MKGESNINLERWRGEMDANVKATQLDVTAVRSDLTQLSSHVTKEIGDLKVSTATDLGKLENKVGMATVKISFITSGAVIVTGIIVSILTAIISAKLGLK